MEDDLLDDKQWRNKDTLIAEAGLDSLQQPVEKHLAELKEQLETRIAEVNRRIATGENEHFKIKSNGRHARWTLEYPATAKRRTTLSLISCRRRISAAFCTLQTVSAGSWTLSPMSLAAFPGSHRMYPP
jgi:hypothetical protein